MVTISINDRYRIRGSDRDFFIEPTPTAVETIAYEYYSDNYCENAGGTDLNVWTADTDTGLVDEEFFELSLIWRLLNRMGLPYVEEKAEYQRAFNQMIAQINPQKVYMDGNFPASSNLPDSDFTS